MSRQLVASATIATGVALAGLALIAAGAFAGAAAGLFMIGFRATVGVF